MTWKPKGNMVQPLVTSIFLLIAQGSEESYCVAKVRTIRRILSVESWSELLGPDNSLLLGRMLPAFRWSPACVLSPQLVGHPCCCSIEIGGWTSADGDMSTAQVRELGAMLTR